jgi:hypothetical protein
MSETSGGSYPFTLDGGTNTVLHLKNTSDQRKWVIVQIQFPDGSTYNPDQVWLEPYQTVAVDVQKLRDENKQDIRGSNFPANANRGQIIWLGTRGHTIIGRAEQVDVGTGTSNSFSCGIPCQCDPNPVWPTMSPSEGEFLVTYSGTPFNTQQLYLDCHHQYYGPYNRNDDADWYSTNSSVASVSGAGQVTANSFGTAEISAIWWEDWHYWEGAPQNECSDEPDSVDASAEITIGCGDERTEIIQEYATYGVNTPHPTCSEFASSGGSTNFSWSELNGGFSSGNPHSPWGIVKSGLTTGLEATRTNYNRGGITLTSGYRCPHGNYAVGGVSQSLHMRGRAADMKSAEHSWTETEFGLLKTAADATSPTESFFWNTYPDHHYHAAW